VKVPTNRKGEIIQPVDTDSIVLGICNKDLGLKLDINHIGRSHPIGEPKDGEISIITRFLTYRQRQLVFRNKKKLKGNPDNMFIAENLTKHRYDLIKRLNALRKYMKIVAIKQAKITTNMNSLQKCSKEFINKAVIIQVQVLYIIDFVFF
jgi:hypothetical protein